MGSVAISQLQTATGLVRTLRVQMKDACPNANPNPLSRDTKGRAIGKPAKVDAQVAGWVDIAIGCLPIVLAIFMKMVNAAQCKLRIVRLTRISTPKTKNARLNANPNPLSRRNTKVRAIGQPTRVDARAKR